MNDTKLHTDHTTCPTCGTPVRVVGETTLHYEPIENVAQLSELSAKDIVNESTKQEKHWEVITRSSDGYPELWVSANTARSFGFHMAKWAWAEAQKRYLAVNNTAEAETYTKTECLEIESQFLQKELTEALDRIDELEAEVERYREALEYYAAPESWKIGYWGLENNPEPRIVGDRGRVAREALK